MAAAKRGTIQLLGDKRKRGEKIVSLTAYDFPTARIEELAGVDFILVGDSAAMAVHGQGTTLGATMDMMIAHTRAVRAGAPNTLVVGDMPFGSYQGSDEQAVASAVRFLAEGEADAVKLEGGNPRSLSRARAIMESGIPLMGHIGLLPQSVRATGGYRVVTSASAERLLAEAMSLEAAGAFAIVIESVEEAVARDLTRAIGIPTIGIGAGRYTDGQILVVSDMLGLTPDFDPKFLRRYADLHSTILQAVTSYMEDVRSGSFPGPENTYSPTGGGVG
jgi:3-methyl-2-oxobutanoate hydroxymethyltransferase